ncbi:hypothetical protein EJB05_19041, partial [Eragrostis curvula]
MIKNPSEEKDVVEIDFTARESLVLLSVSLALKSWWRPSVTFSITDWKLPISLESQTTCFKVCNVGSTQLSREEQ